VRISIQLTMAIAVMLTCSSVDSAHAAWPWSHTSWPWTPLEGTPRIDPIPPLGTHLPDSYRRRYNRPSYVGGKIAAKIAPSSQEAMAFHRAESLGLYDNNGIKGLANGKHCPPQRVEQHYFYPKPWEALAVGPRPDRTEKETNTTLPESIQLDAPLPLPTPVGEPEFQLPPPPK